VNSIWYRAGLRVTLCIIFLFVLFGATCCSRKPAPQQPGSASLAIQVLNAPTALPKNPIATVQVDPLHLGAKIPKSFLGFSFEYPDLEKFVGTTRKPLPSFVRLLNQLRDFNGPPVIRVGGESQDESWYSNTRTEHPDNVTFTIGRELTQALDAAAQATQSKLILGLNLGADDPSILLNWVEAAQNDFLPEQVLSFELGNEPDNYQNHLVNGAPLRDKHWDYDLYAKQFDHYKEMLLSHLKAKKLLAAPAFLKGFLPDVANFIERESMDVGLVTLHYYALNGCGDKSPSSNAASTALGIKTLLRPTASADFFKAFDPAIGISKRLSVPLRIDEVGPVSCDSLPEVSGSFASALWSLEFMFDFASAGGAGVNFTANSTLTPEPEVAPIFYGMLLFGQAIQKSASFIPLSVEGQRSIRAWSTLDKNGLIRIVLMNKDPTQSGTVVLKIPHTMGPAKIVRLTAPSLSSQKGILLGGQTFDGSPDGSILGIHSEWSLTPTHQQFPIALPAGSAALVSVQFNDN
jgi:hypothetical protein